MVERREKGTEGGKKLYIQVGRRAMEGNGPLKRRGAYKFKTSASEPKLSLGAGRLARNPSLFLKKKNIFTWRPRVSDFSVGRTWGLTVGMTEFPVGSKVFIVFGRAVSVIFFRAYHVLPIKVVRRPSLPTVLSLFETWLGTWEPICFHER